MSFLQSLLSSSPDHIKRPSNSFMLWAQDNRNKLSKDNPTLTNAEISKLLGQKWNTLSNTEKQIYKDKSMRVKQEHKTQYPDYIYRPKHKLGTIDTYSCKKKTKKTINTNIVKPETYSLNKKSIINQTISDNINSKINLPINFNDHWLSYKEGYNYYETIELFYSKL